MDELDKKIIEMLEKNSRESFLNISKTLKVSEGTIRKRVKNLLKKGVIERFTLKLKREVAAIIGLETNPSVKTEDIIKRLQKLKINTIYEVAGRFDVVCMIEVETMEDMNNLLEAIRATEGVIHTETFTVLKQR